MNNETIGISTEIAIAKYFDINVPNNYYNRGDQTIINNIIKVIDKNNKNIFKKSIPKELIAFNNGPIDFILSNNKTLSIKTNKR